MAEENWNLKQKFKIVSPSESAIKDIQTSVFRFSNLNVSNEQFKDPSCRLARENAIKARTEIDEMPEFGEGSEFGRKERLEAKKRKFTRKVSENSPWIFKTGNKRFRGTFEPGVASSAAYYVFYHDTEGIFQAVPLSSWYSFSAHKRFKALTAEEAEERFVKREKIMNFFQLKASIKKEEDGADGEEDSKASKRKKYALKVSYSDEENSDLSEEEDLKLANKPQKDGKKGKKEKDEFDSDKEREAFEDSDDGDIESKEIEYMSDSEEKSDSEGELRGVGDEIESESSEDEEQKPPENPEELPKPEGVVEVKKENTDSDDSELDVDSNDVDKKLVSLMENTKKPSTFNFIKEEKPTSSSTDPSSAGSSGLKIKVEMDGLGPSAAKKAKPSKESEEKNIEEEIIRYLSRKPITVNDLIKKLRRKYPLSAEKFNSLVGQILNNLHSTPHFCKQKINNQYYFSMTKS